MEKVVQLSAFLPVARAGLGAGNRRIRCNSCPSLSTVHQAPPSYLAEHILQLYLDTRTVVTPSLEHGETGPEMLST